MHQYYISSNLKTKFKPYGIENKNKANIKKHKCSSPAKFSFYFSNEFILLFKKYLLPND
jgi:hypothetical protein